MELTTGAVTISSAQRGYMAPAPPQGAPGIFMVSPYVSRYPVDDVSAERLVPSPVLDKAAEQVVVSQNRLL